MIDNTEGSTPEPIRQRFRHKTAGGYVRPPESGCLNDVELGPEIGIGAVLAAAGLGARVSRGVHRAR